MFLDARTYISTVSVAKPRVTAGKGHPILEHLFSDKMLRQGVLPPAESGKFITEHAEHVKIHQEGLDKLCQEMLSSISNKLEIPDLGTNIIQPSRDDPIAVDWIFVADTLNFCFWSKNGEQKWKVDGHAGYYALEAALSRAVKEGHNIWNPEFYSKINEDQLRHIMRSDTEVQIPLFSDRIRVLHEVGKILLEKYNGTFKNCIEKADKSGVKLLGIIVNDFPCFRDEAVFKEKKVSLYKRAQILVADLWNFFGGTAYGEFEDIDRMTMFADYRVPQVLVYFRVLSYSEDLMDKLQKDELLPNGSTEEVEIRGCSIQAVELLKKALEKKITSKQMLAELPNSSLIDYYLWCYRRKYAHEMERIPFHKTLSIFY